MQNYSYNHFSIRDYLPEDLSTLYKIDKICFPDYMAYSRAALAYYVEHAEAVSKVACLDGRILGFVVGCIESVTDAHVITLDVIPEARRHGVGLALMAVLHTEFRARGITQVGLEVAANNDGAQWFYERIGYKRLVLLRNYYKSRADAYRMWLSL